MRRLRALVFLLALPWAAACRNVPINFDQFPNGMPVPSWNGSNQATVIINAQYAPAGVREFQSMGNGVLPVPGSSASPPNFVCGWDGSAYSGNPTSITLDRATSNIWLTVTLGGPTVTVYDVSGRVLESRGVGLGKQHFQQCGISRIEVSSAGRYCFDDLIFRTLTGTLICPP